MANVLLKNVTKIFDKKVWAVKDLNVEIAGFITTMRHAYSHFKIVMDVFECKYISGRVKRRGSVDHCWVTVNQLDRYPFPKANNKFIPLLKTTTQK